MNEGFVIREMTDADRDVWVEMYAALFPGGTETGMNAEIDRILSAPKRAGYCALQQGRVLGFAEYNIREFANGCISQPVPFLEGIWVRPDQRGKGVAKALMNHLETLARTQGFQEFGSDVEANNQASLDMHKSLGFEETETVVYFRKQI